VIHWQAAAVEDLSQTDLPTLLPTVLMQHVGTRMVFHKQ